MREGICSNDHSIVITACGELAKELYSKENFAEHIDLIKILALRVELKSKEGLGAIITYLSTWLVIFRNQAELKKLSQSLLNILHNYKEEIPEGLDKPFIELRLYMIARVLQYWKFDNDIVIPILQAKRKSKYYNVRNYKFETHQQ